MKVEKVEKQVPNLKDKKMYVVHIENLSQALKFGLKLKKKYIALLNLNKAIGWNFITC